MNIKIDLNFDLKDLEDKDIPNRNVGKDLSGYMANATKGDSLKYYDWSRSLYKGESIEVDRSDFNTIEKFVREHDQLTHIGKAQILIALKKASESAK